jgi:hypothetical protein
MEAAIKTFINLAETSLNKEIKATISDLQIIVFRVDQPAAE